VNENDARQDPRFDHEATVLIEDLPNGTYLPGKMVNYSETGLCFQSNVAQKIGAALFFGIENSPYETCTGVYRGWVRWCRRLPAGDTIYSYGVGVQYDLSDPLARPRLAHRLHPQPPPPRVPAQRIPPAASSTDQRKHPRRFFDKPVFYAVENRHYRGTIRDISKSGIFIHTENRMDAGQRLILAIPSTKRPGGLKVTGEIVRVDDKGVAVRFKRIVGRKRSSSERKET
jgi:Tfp pilus assembly protein PilZ